MEDRNMGTEYLYHYTIDIPNKACQSKKDVI